GALTFMPADPQRYPGLQLAIEACWPGQWATTSLNAANEVAVAAFLAGRISFTTIAETCDAVLQQMPTKNLTSIEELLAYDNHARLLAQQYVERVASSWLFYGRWVHLLSP